MGAGVGAGVGDGAGLNVVETLSENRQAKYVLFVPGTVAVPQPKRLYAASSEVRCGDELMKLRWARPRAWASSSCRPCSPSR